jgi:hypothetical protein
LDLKFVKIIVGSAVIDCIRTVPYDSSLNETYARLKQLYLLDEPSIPQIKSLHDALVRSSNENQREVGFMLEPVIDFHQPERN